MRLGLAFNTTLIKVLIEGTRITYFPVFMSYVRITNFFYNIKIKHT